MRTHERMGLGATKAKPHGAQCALSHRGWGACTPALVRQMDDLKFSTSREVTNACRGLCNLPGIQLIRIICLEILPPALEDFDPVMSTFSNLIIICIYSDS